MTTTALVCFYNLFVGEDSESLVLFYLLLHGFGQLSPDQLQHLEDPVGPPCSVHFLIMNHLINQLLVLHHFNVGDNGELCEDLRRESYPNEYHQ